MAREAVEMSLLWLWNRKLSRSRAVSNFRQGYSSLTKPSNWSQCRQACLPAPGSLELLQDPLLHRTCQSCSIKDPCCTSDFTSSFFPVFLPTIMPRSRGSHDAEWRSTPRATFSLLSSSCAIRDGMKGREDQWPALS